MARVLLWVLFLSGATSQAATGEQFRAVVVPSHDVELVSPVRGVIRKILVEEGDRVKKGDLLVELDSEVAEAQLAIEEFNAKSTAALEAAEANLRVKRADYQRQKTLHEKGVGSDADLEKAEFELKYAQSLVTVEKEKRTLGQLRVKLQRARLEELRIRAPFDGIVMRKLQDVGEATLEDRPVLRLVVLDILHVLAYVPSAVASRLRVGQMAEVELEGLSPTRRNCRIVMIDPVIDAASDTRRVKLELPNPNDKVPAGTKALVRFKVEAGARPTPQGTERRQ